MTDTPIKRWMKMPSVSIRRRYAHFILSRTEDGTYITTCGKGNSKDFEELTKDEIEFLSNNRGFLCRACDSSPRYYQVLLEERQKEEAGKS